ADHCLMQTAWTARSSDGRERQHATRFGRLAFLEAAIEERNLSELQRRRRCSSRFLYTIEGERVWARSSQ
ncbi:hypothetical protein PQQ63_38655, partial [Paraburkholderia metrosideri]